MKKGSFRGKVAPSAKTSSKSSGGSNHLIMPKGVSLLILDEDMKRIKLDFLPYQVNETALKSHPDKAFISEEGLWYRRPYKLHRSIGVDNKNFVCPTSIGKKCPICEAQKELFNSDKKAAIALYPKPRELYVVIPLDNKFEDEPYVWDMAESLFHDCLRDSLEEDEENEVFPDLEEGKTLECKLKWKAIGDGRPFPEVVSIDFKDRKPYKESIMDDIPDLDECLNVLSYDELESIFLALEESEPRSKKGKESNDEEEEKPRNRKSSRQEEPEEEDDEDNCIACEGSGKNSRGNECRICEGTGKKQKEEPKNEKTEKTERTERRQERQRPERESSEKQEKPKEKEVEASLVWADIEAMSESKLMRLCREKKLSTDPDDFDDDVTSFRKAIAKELGIKPPAAKADTKKQEPATSNGTCPHKHVFGKDTDKYNECDRCDVWNECIEAKEKK